MLREKSSDAERERFQKMHDMIAKKAYELYEKGSCRHGRDFDDWLQAERMVKRNARLR